MNEFLSKFSLQNFLRQFYCGVVFFLPLYLFVPWKVHEFFFPRDNSYIGLICMGALACVIGTLIYHLEKNLYSYVIQGIYEWLEERKSLEKYNRIIIAAVLLCGLIFSLLYYLHSLIGVIIVLLFTLCLMKLFLGEKVINTTIISWIVEGSDAKEDKDKNHTETKNLDDTEPNEIEHRDLGNDEITMHDLRSIARRIAVWSDFIHCMQSCCFAWIFGTCFSYWIIEKNCCPCCAQYMLPTMVWSVIAALAILFIESAFIDHHRYSFVMEMKRQYKKLYPQSPYVETKTDDH